MGAGVNSGSVTPGVGCLARKEEKEITGKKRVGEKETKNKERKKERERGKRRINIPN